MQERQLFSLFPGARSAIPWTPLATLPTPVSAVAIPLPDGPIRSVAIKHDDRAGDPYGGNKVRKLEFLIGDALAKNATRLITAGAFGSHHALATTVYGRRAGLDVTVILFPQRITPHVREILFMLQGLGADIRFTRRMEFVPVALARVRRTFGSSAYVIPPGGSNALGTLGYVECGLELAQQWSATNAARPRRIHVAAGTLGTTAGLALGLAIAGENIEIAATRITSTLVTNERALQQLMRRTRALLAEYGAVPDITDVMRRITFVHDQIGDGYGRSTAASEKATEIFAAAGIVLDPTYTAKAAAALVADPLTAEGETMFVHTLSGVAPVEALENISARDLPPQIAARLLDKD